MATSPSSEKPTDEQIRTQIAVMLFEANLLDVAGVDRELPQRARASATSSAKTLRDAAALIVSLTEATETD